MENPCQTKSPSVIKGMRLAVMGTPLDNETATLTRLRTERNRMVRELKALDVRLAECVRVIGTLSDGIRHETIGGV